jgi:hypothetical protein
LTTATTLGFVAKRVDTTLRAQVRIGAGLEVVIVVVTRFTWSLVAWSTVVKLARWALTALTPWTLLAIAPAGVAVGIAWWAVT